MSNPGPDVGDARRARFSYSQRVLHAFIVDGRLVSIPARERKRHVVLRYLASTDFEEGRDYPERDVDMRLALRHRDVAALRRYLVDGRYLERSGGVYRRRPMVAWPVDRDENAGASEHRLSLTSIVPSSVPTSADDQDAG